MRKAGKKQIEKALQEYKNWRNVVDERIQYIDKKAQTILKEWADDVKSRIEQGDLSLCTTALSRSVMRTLKDFETGFYVGVTETGGFRVAPYNAA